MRYRLSALLIFVLVRLSGQSFQLSIIPGSEYNLSRRDEWKLSVTNTANTAVNAYFYGVATEASRGKIYEIRSRARFVSPGLNTFGTQNYVGLEPFDIVYQDEQLRQYGIQTNGLPAGDYDLCITAYSASDSSELGNVCYSFSVDSYTPPILLSPENEDTLCDAYPYFTWLPPPVFKGQNFTYTLRIYESQNVQTTLSAAQTNPLFYERNGIPTPLVQYGINARNFRPNHRYTWLISAEINNKTVAISEPGSFYFCIPNIAGSAAQNTKPSLKNEAVPGIPYMELKSNVGNNYSVTDKGHLNFQYNNRFDQRQIGFRILDSRMQVLYSQLLDAHYGINYYRIDMASTGKLISGKRYEIQVTDPQGNIQKALFKFLN
jgi:hypothetical protein